MTVTKDPRFGQDRWSSGTDPWPARAGWAAQGDLVTTKAVLFGEGTFAARPAFSAAKKGQVYWATDQQRLYYQSATAWTEVSPVGGGGAAVPNWSRAGGEGASRIAARADHRHPDPIYATRAMLGGSGAQLGGWSNNDFTKVWAGYTVQNTDSQGNFSITLPETPSGILSVTATPYYYDNQSVLWWPLVRGDHSNSGGLIGLQARRSSDGTPLGAANIGCMFNVVYQVDV